MGKRIVEIYTCDRCGKEILNPLNIREIKIFKQIFFLRWQKHEQKIHFNIDCLCEECHKSLRKWYNNGKT